MLSTPEKLSSKVRALLASGATKPDLLLSAMSLVELATLTEKGRVKILFESGASIEAAIAAIQVRIVPMDQEIAIETGRLTDFDHFDPADRIIVASARIENAVLITADRTLRRYKNVATLW